MSFTASSQTDSTFCFTQEQVKTFLRTKVELNQCLESNEILLTEIAELTDENYLLENEKKALQIESDGLRKQRNRSRLVAIGTGVVGILSTILHFVK